MAEKALEATRKGESLDGVFAQQRKELHLTHNPRKHVVQDMEEGKEVEDVPKVQLNGCAATNTKEKATISV